MAETAGNAYLNLVVGPMLRRAQWVFPQTAWHRAPHSWTEHLSLYEAIAAGDEAEAEARAVAHVAAARRSYLAALVRDLRMRILAPETPKLTGFCIQSPTTNVSYPVPRPPIGEGATSMHLPRRLVAALAALPLVSAAACSGGGASVETLRLAAPRPTTARSRTAAPSPWRSPRIPTRWTRARPPRCSAGRSSRSICEKLYDIDADSKIVPQLATALPDVSGDGKTVTIKLRSGVKFNDGTPFDAAAVKKSLDRHRTDKKSARVADLAAVSKVDVVDPSTVKLTLSRPFTPLTAAARRPRRHDHVAQGAGRRGRRLRREPRLRRAVQVRRAAPRATRSCWTARRTTTTRPRSSSTSVIYKIIVDPNVRAANLKSGDVQAAEELATTTVAGVQADPNLRVVSGGGLGNYGIDINVGNAKGSTEKPGPVNTPLGRSPELRQAFELSLDRDRHQQGRLQRAVPSPTAARCRWTARSADRRDLLEARRRPGQAARRQVGCEDADPGQAHRAQRRDRTSGSARSSSR